MPNFNVSEGMCVIPCKDNGDTESGSRGEVQVPARGQMLSQKTANCDITNKPNKATRTLHSKCVRFVTLSGRFSG